MLGYLNNIDGGEGDMPWHYGGQSLLALRALVLLDADAHDVYRLYLKKGDLEHDHGPYRALCRVLDRHGVRNEADVRFGIYLTLMGYLDTDTDPSLLLDGAERYVTAERLADIVIEGAKHRGDDFWEIMAKAMQSTLRPSATLRSHEWCYETLPRAGEASTTRHRCAPTSRPVTTSRRPSPSGTVWLWNGRSAKVWVPPSTATG